MGDEGWQYQSSFDDGGKDGVVSDEEEQALVGIAELRNAIAKLARREDR